MQTVIVATNFSKASHNAMRFVAEALKGKEFRVVLFNFFSVSVHTLNARLSVDEIDRIAKIRVDQLTSVANSLMKDYGIEVITYSASGLFLEELNNCKVRYGAEMIVTGMADKSMIQDIMGNTTSLLINRLKCPILSIPIHAKYNGIKTILFACDILRGVHQQVLQNVRKFALSFDAQVEIFHVRKSAEEILVPYMMEGIKQNFLDLNHTYKDVYADVIVKAIEQEIEKLNADILIMVPYRYGFWNSVIHRSKTKEMASSSKIPLLSISL
ncbi:MULTISPECIES: universal stress protein [Sphingobacterium]|uniref:universal stress protein n=1 Tax=Sphingobacterium TaxID=28453 RepID=UPI00257BD273|nr:MULTISPECIES: universal stress protein [Sphingobacterium]